MKRMKRSAVARETVEIIERGNYKLPDDTIVSIDNEVSLAVSKTANFTPEALESIVRDIQARSTATLSPPRIEVCNQTTLAAARKLYNRKSDEPILCLNFASAKNPGGGFLGGAEAQEESLARASALYACLNSQQEYYEVNRHCGTCLYTDNMILSPDVPVFRDDRGDLLSEPYQVSFLTSPAVNIGALARNEPTRVAEAEQVMLARIEKLLSLAIMHGYSRLVLGAWGCGVFRNDPGDMARWLASFLVENSTYNRVFDEIVFAIFDKTKENKFIGPFEKQFSHQ